MFGDHGTSYWHGETHNYGILCDEILVDFGGDPCCRGNFIMLSFLTYDLNTTADISIVMYSVYIFFSIYTVPNIMLNAERDALFYISINHNYPTFLGLFFPLYEFELPPLEWKKLRFFFPAPLAGNLRHHRFPNTNFATLSTMTDWRRVGCGVKWGASEFFPCVKEDNNLGTPEYVLVVPAIRGFVLLKGFVFILTSNQKYWFM